MPWPRKFLAQYFRAHRQEGDFPLIPEGVTELRVHGVSGAPPEALLNDPNPLLVSGDETAAFYRRVLGPETATDSDSFPPRAVEAYSWSGMNSRRSSRAFWMLLFPFGMANFAGWLVGRGRSQSFKRALIRTTGLVLTLHYVITAMVLSVDLLAFQCARAPQCLQLQWLGPLRIAHGILDPSRPIRLLVVTSLLPIALLIALLVIGKRNPHEYEERKFNEMTGVPTGPPEENQKDVKVDDIPLSNARFWRAPDVVDIQALLHVAAGLAFVGAVLAFTIRLIVRQADESAFFWVGLLQLAVIGAAITQIVRAGWQLQWGQNYGSWRVRAWVLIGTATLLNFVVALLGWSVEIQDEASRAATLSGIWQALGIVIVVEFVLVLMMLAMADWKMASAIILIGVGLFQTFLPFKSKQQPHISIATAPAPIEATVKKLGTVIVDLGTWARPLRWEWRFWVLVELLLAALCCTIYFWRRKNRDDPNSPNPDNHLHNFFWIFAGLAAIVLIAVPSVRSVTERDPRPDPLGPIPVWIWPVICSVVIALGYLLVMLKIQLMRAHDFPPRWQLRGGGPGTVLAVGAISITMISAAFIILSAQVLGDDLPLRDKFLANSMPAGFNAEDEDCKCRADDPQPGRISPIDPGSDEQSTEADRLDPRFEGFLGEARIWYHDELGWIASSGLAALLVLLLAVVARIVALQNFRFNRGLRDDIAKKLTEDLDSQGAQWSRERIHDLAKNKASARKWASLVDDADWLLSVGATALIACLLSVGVAQLANRELAALDNIARIATVSLVVLAGLSVFLVRSSYRQGNIRKAVGILWDVTSFFPRRYQALAPPCYAERAVPELRDRLVLLTKLKEGTRQEGKVLLLAHSQGTLLSFAVFRTFENEKCLELLKRIWFVSYGSMLQRLFGRAYGAVVHGEGLVTLKNYLEGYRVASASTDNPAAGDAKGQDLQFPEPENAPAHWQNFARNTDYLGGRVFARQFRYQSPKIEPERKDEVLFDDPPRPKREPGETKEAPFWRHSFDYLDDEEDPRFEEHVAEVLRAMMSEGVPNRDPEPNGEGSSPASPEGPKGEDS